MTETSRSSNSSLPIKAFLNTSLSSFGTAVLTFISGILIARALSPAGRAEYGAVLLICQTLATLACLSFFDGAIIELRKQKRNPRAALRSLFIIALAITFVATLAVATWQQFFAPEFETLSSLHFTLIAALIILDILLYQCFSAVERSEMKFTLSNLTRVVNPASFSICILVAWFALGDNLTPTITLGLFLFAKSPMILLWFSRYRRDFSGGFSWPLVKTASSTGLKLHYALALAAIANPLDRLIAINNWQSELLGNYFVAFSAVGVGYAIITTSINTVLFPYMAGINGPEKQQRTHLILRLTMVISVLTVAGGCLIIPYAIPLLYGAEYNLASGMAIGLLFALSIQPLRAVILETSRSLGIGRPSVEMAITSIITMLIMFLFTGLETPRQMIWALGLANVCSTLVGARHLIANNLINLQEQLIPSYRDLVLFIQMLKSYRSKTS